ncbi:methylase involved in ubiquinone/menaquinone biosynthesis [Aequorivita sublithincola DSM 14238]|uniref:Methylase involved in ubiquinone/menaquinone biosynthesis n=1 Tax=Aequorivita sublithincola (strain DSM 14238 / LMG 21431 / ACAM 643 / 9-3) TaxID=746697 RepID=I3YUN0_AEQSU|nr:class I SAM-dependent methyltransferase [Aequorivita sublithincola]AFL80698.1 methylase involved in ubiquinone/menaquinone biosynthesis [Aequorivita sublithincola DSM 14238]
MIQHEEIEKVENFWNEHLCGKQFVNEEIYTPAFFNEYRAFRYKKEHHLLEIINEYDSSNKDTLEIGLGVGADTTQWAAKSKSHTGIDLTDEAVYSTTKHLELLGLKGTIVKGSAEELPFKNESFDLVYSQGVLHHTDNIENTFSGIHRILRPDGEFIIMLYTKDSFNYWFRIQMYFRARMLAEIFKNKIGLKSNPTWAEHYQNFKKMGWKYLSWKEFPHHCTDGPSCTIANIYYKKEIIDLLAKHNLIVERTEKYHFPISSKHPKLERSLAKYLGFYRFYWGKKI